MAFQPQKLDQIQNPYWKQFIYGLPGAGKTIYAAGSQTLPTFLIDVDGGACSVRTHAVKFGRRTDLVWVAQVNSLESYQEALDWFMARITSFGVLVIDSVTELQRLIIAGVAKKTGHQQLTQPDWGVVRTITEGVFIAMRYLPINVVFTAHEMQKFDVQHNIDMIRPSFDGRSQYEYAKHVSLLARLEVFQIPTGEKLPNGRAQVETQRWLNCGPDPFIHAKDRSAALSQYEYPDLDYILSKMTAGFIANPQPQGEIDA